MYIYIYIYIMYKRTYSIHLIMWHSNWDVFATAPGLVVGKTHENPAIFGFDSPASPKDSTWRR